MSGFWNFDLGDYAPTPCPRCGAATVAEAAMKCLPSQDHTGEYDCPGDRADAQGRLLQVSSEAIAREDARFDEWAKTPEGAAFMAGGEG